MHSENTKMMKIPQETHCRCHFLSPSKERIIHGYPDKAHNYGYGSVRLQIQTDHGYNRISPIRVSPYDRTKFRSRYLVGSHILH